MSSKLWGQRENNQVERKNSFATIKSTEVLDTGHNTDLKKYRGRTENKTKKYTYIFHETTDSKSTNMKLPKAGIFSSWIIIFVGIFTVIIEML